MKSTGLFILSKLLFNVRSCDAIRISRQYSSTFTAYCVTWLLNTTWILLWDPCVLFKVFIPFYSKQDGKKTTPNTATMVPKHLEFNNQLPNEMTDQS